MPAGSGAAFGSMSRPNDHTYATSSFGPEHVKISRAGSGASAATSSSTAISARIINRWNSSLTSGPLNAALARIDLCEVAERQIASDVSLPQTRPRQVPACDLGAKVLCVVPVGGPDLTVRVGFRVYANGYRTRLVVVVERKRKNGHRIGSEHCDCIIQNGGEEAYVRHISSIAQPLF